MSEKGNGRYNGEGQVVVQTYQLPEKFKTKLSELMIEIELDIIEKVKCPEPLARLVVGETFVTVGTNIVALSRKELGEEPTGGIIK